MKKRITLFAPIFAVFVIISFQISAQQKFPDFPPKNINQEMDMGQMLFQLGIERPKLPSKLEDPNAPKDAFPRDSLNPENNWTNSYGHTITRSGWGLWNNYSDKSIGFFPGKDSFRLGNYTPIDLLKTKNGKQITTPTEWWHERRPEIFKDIQEQLYGSIPAQELLPKVNFKVKITNGGTGNNKWIEKEITGEIDVSGYPEVRDVPVISAVMRLPANATKPVPVMVVFGGFGNTVDRYWSIASPHGWGVCSFNPNALQPDNGTGLTSYLIGLVNKGNWRKPGDWGSIVVWSWGISRLMDYFETDKDVNEKAIGLTGHSRYGKATLVSLAYEPRIAIGFPSDAGSLGTKMNRRHWGQDLENSASESEYHWMAGNFFNYCGELVPGQYLPRKIENLTVDAHSLLALCAPRPLLLNGGNSSSWCDPYGMYLTTGYASPVYELLGKTGIVMNDEKPQVDKGYIDGTLAYRYHNGGHTDAPEWPAFFEFAARFIEATTLNVSKDVITIGPEKNGKAGFTIVANKKWKINNKANWISINKNAGSTNDSITIAVTENKEKQARTADLTIEAEGRNVFVTLNQGTANETLSISKKELSLTYQTGNQASFVINSNSAWTITDSENWISADSEAGINSKEINVIAQPNPRIEKRTAKLTVLSNKGISETMDITQEEGEPTLRLSAESLQLVASQSTNSSIWVMTNATVEVESKEDWVSGEISSQGRFNRLAVKVLENTSGKIRSAKLALKVKDLPTQFVEVVQEGK